MFVGKVDWKNIERSFITFDHEISPRIDTIKNFRENKDFYETIKKNHVAMLGVLKLIENLNYDKGDY